MVESTHVIEIHKDHAEFVVRIVPEPDIEGLGASFALKTAAWGYASGLRMVKGWPIRDLTGEAAHG
jgi:hypothetical protein